MKRVQFALTFASLAVIVGCSSKMSENSSLQQTQQQFQDYQSITQQYQINDQWWKGYQNSELNRLVEMALTNNINLAKATIAVNTALYNANLVGANLVPTFSGSGQSSVSKGVGSPKTNLISTGVSTTSNQIGFNLSYTIDLWGRLRDSANAAEWEHKATEEDLQATRLSLINSVVSSYYNLAYFNDAIRVTQQSIKAYEEINRILSNKYTAGLIDRLGVDQSTQSILAAKNTLINLKTGQKTAEQTLRNLLNLAPNTPLAISPTLAKAKLQGVDMNVPVSVIANRPDIIAGLHRLQGAFKSLTAMEKSWFPTITLGGGLASSAKKAGDVLDNPVANGVLSFNLPFLDWNRVQNNINISEENYKLAKLNYEQKITSALNEIDTYYYAYQQSGDSYANLQKKYQSDKKISGYYKNRYDQGVVEMREWLNALNTERNSELALLDAKFTQLKNEVAVYQAMAGKFSR